MKSFQIVQLESGCCDHVYIYDGNVIDSTTQIGYYTEEGTEWELVSTTGNEMTVRFFTDGSVYRKGFAMTLVKS